MKAEGHRRDGLRGTAHVARSAYRVQGTAPTPLQEWFAVALAVLGDARDALSPVEFRVLVWIFREHLEIEAGELAVVEAEQATGGAS